jgi:hypothetical protein
MCLNDGWRLCWRGNGLGIERDAMTSGTAHDHDPLGFIDAAGHLGNIRFAGDHSRNSSERGLG